MKKKVAKVYDEKVKSCFVEVVDQDRGVLICTKNGSFNVPARASEFRDCRKGDKVVIYVKDFSQIVGVDIIGKYKFIHTDSSLKKARTELREKQRAWLANHESPILREISQQFK